MRRTLAAWLGSSLGAWAGPPVAFLVACSAPLTGMAQAQQTAQAFNMDARFGRSQLVLDQIAPAARDEYSLRHRDWGAAIRVADVELAGMKSNGDKQVDIVVRVAWYRPEQQELRSTTLEQAWRAKLEGWELVGEKRVDGDVGLLGEAVVYQGPSEPPRPSQFPTVRLTGGD
jgi:hypothetical protein